MEEGPIIFSGYDRLLRDYWQRNSPQASLVAGAGNAQSTMLLLELAVGTVDTTNKWTTTTGGTGTAAAIAASADQTHLAGLKFATAAAADVTAITAKSLATNPLVSTSVYMYPKMVLEFMFSTDRAGGGLGPADASFMGLSNIDAALGTTNNIVGLRFTNSTAVWASVTDKAGTEEANNVLTETAGVIYRVKIVLTNVQAQFWIDSGSGLAVVATHVTASSLPIVLLKPNFYFKQVGAAGTNYYIHAVRWYISDEL